MLFYQKTKKPSVGADIVLIVLWFVVVFLIRAFNIIDFKRLHGYVRILCYELDNVKIIAVGQNSFYIRFEFVSR